MPTVEDAIALAVEAHQGQRDKANQAYILHPLRVMFAVQRMTNDPDAMIVAVLHDVLEDTPITADDLRTQGYSERIITALQAVTKRDGETYPEFVQRARENSLARWVKLADIEDNMDVRRLTTITEKDRERLQRYRNAWQQLRDD